MMICKVIKGREEKKAVYTWGFLFVVWFVLESVLYISIYTLILLLSYHFLNRSSFDSSSLPKPAVPVVRVGRVTIRHPTAHVLPAFPTYHEPI